MVVKAYVKGAESTNVVGDNMKGNFDMLELASRRNATYVLANSQP